MKKQAFTLIELLVVIVIIGILATISTATFLGYSAKARDVGRQTFVRNTQQIMIASQIGEDSPDYRLGDNDQETASNLVALLRKQGYSMPAPVNGIGYWIALNSALDLTTPASDFAIIACKEETLQDPAISDTSDPNDYAFIAGTIAFSADDGNDDNDGAYHFDNFSNFCSTYPPTSSVYREMPPEIYQDNNPNTEWFVLDLNCVDENGIAIPGGACH